MTSVDAILLISTSAFASLLSVSAFGSSSIALVEALLSESTISPSLTGASADGAFSSVSFMILEVSPSSPTCSALTFSVSPSFSFLA